MTRLNAVDKALAQLDEQTALLKRIHDLLARAEQRELAWDGLCGPQDADEPRRCHCCGIENGAIRGGRLVVVDHVRDGVWLCALCRPGPRGEP